MRCRPSGPVTATIALVGEAPGAEEELEGLPFIGKAGQELDRMCKDAHMPREWCFITNVTHERPPSNEIGEWIVDRKTSPDSSYIRYRGRWVKPFIVDECERLYAELRAVQPNVVVAFGNTPLWALCPQSGVAKWRGSHLISDAIPGLKVIPTYHPAAVLRQYSWRWITVQDLRRAKGESLTPLYNKPKWSFGVKPTYDEATQWLTNLLSRCDSGPTPFTCDLEIFRREILCVGLGTSRLSAFCIPFLWTKGWYWSPEQHAALVSLLSRVLLHPNARVVNQNLSFDIQYLFWRFFIRPKAHFDTMIAQNLLYSGMPKDLAYLASMYCDYYVYWKDDGKFWVEFDDDKLWEYNCLDCIYTYEIYEVQQKAVLYEGLSEQMAFQMTTFEHLMGMMIRGVRVNHANKVAVLGELEALIDELHEEVAFLSQADLVGEKGNLSPKKLAHLFYSSLGYRAYYSKEGNVTCDDEALNRLTRKALWLKPLTDRINQIRSYGTAVDVCRKRTDRDHRWRTSYNVAGTTTYRLSSSENPLDSGLNLQNLTLGKEIGK